MKRRWISSVCVFLFAAGAYSAPGKVEILRDPWGVPHVFAGRESDGFFGLGYACAEDRILQMELFRRRATGRLAEVFGAQWVDSDRKFRIAGIARHCAEAFENLPPQDREDLRAYAAGVNAWVRANPEKMVKRFAVLGKAGRENGKENEPEAEVGSLLRPWTPPDCLAAWLAVAEIFDPLISDGPAVFYHDFQQLVSEVGEAEAFKQRGMTVDNFAAVVPESEMAKNKRIYARLQAMKPTPGYLLRGAETEPLHFSHAWAVGGARSTTGKPILESDPQTSVNNPPIWYEFHLCAGRYDVRGIGVAGCPALLIGWNRRVAWGATALGVGCSLTYIDKIADGGRAYQFRGETIPFERRFERIEVKGAAPVIQEVLTNRHGFVFNSLARQNRAGEALVGWFQMAHDKATSVRGMLEMMRAGNWKEFRAAMEHYYSPGLHIVYADIEGNLGYQTLAHLPLTRTTRRMALEGWTGENEVTARIPLDEMPHMLNPDSHVISHANNLPVGSWYPHDLGLATGGIGDTARSMRLRQLLAGDRKLSVEDFEALIHRDSVDAVVSALLPAARKVVEEDKISDPNVLRALAALNDWNGQFDAALPAYPTAMALAGAKVPAFRGSPLGAILGGGEGGVCHLARLVGERFAKDGATPKNATAREYLVAWLRLAGGGAPPARVTQRPGGERTLPGRNTPVEDRSAARPMGEAPTTNRTDRPGPAGPANPSRQQRPAARPEIHPMPYQVNGPLRFPALDPNLDLVSPPLVCGNGSTIWSQKGNSYTHIVDLSDVDNSRSVLPPGISEDAASPFHADQIPIWVKGATHPAPLSRKKVETLAVSKTTLNVVAYDGPTSCGEQLAQWPHEPGARFIPAIPAVETPKTAGRDPSMPDRSASR